MSNQKDEASFIPASQRPDGTWRKARRVKEGYVPQEEVPLYESKGKKFMNKSAAPADPARVNGYTAHRTIPGLYIQDPPAATSKKEKKKLAASAAQLANDMHKLTMNSVSNGECDAGGGDAAADPAKKLKNLRKRLREVEALEEKIRTGKVEKPEPDQLAKVARKVDLILQISQLESTIK